MTRLTVDEWKTITGTYLGRLKLCLLLCFLIVLPAQRASACEEYETKIVCVGKQYDEMPQDISQYVTDLDLSRNNIVKIDKDTLKMFVDIVKLNFSHNLITHIHVRAFFSLRDIETLDLSFNCITTIDEAILYNNPKIKHFFVSHNAGLNKIPVISSKSLETFMLSNCNIEEINETTFRGIESIQALDLSHNNLKYIGTHAFDSINSLTVLDVSNNKLQDAQFINSDCSFSLKSLDISFNNISTASSTTFEVLLSLPQVNYRNNSWICDENLKIIYEKFLKKEKNLNLMCISPINNVSVSWHYFYAEPQEVLPTDSPTTLSPEMSSITITKEKVTSKSRPKNCKMAIAVLVLTCVLFLVIIVGATIVYCLLLRKKK